jgi:FkbM family methyltransferase
VRQGNARALLGGEQVFSGIREIWARNVYLKNGFLEIPKGALVIDLGANMGNFTTLALAHGLDVRVIAVEPSRSLCANLDASVNLNHWQDRVRVKRAFVGVSTQIQQSVAGDPDYAGVPFMSEEEFVREFDIERVDFLKCDIEGSEFFLLSTDSRLLSMTRYLAIEIHAWGGSVPDFLGHLRHLGFEMGSVVYDADGTCIAQCRRLSSADGSTKPCAAAAPPIPPPHYPAAIPQPAAAQAPR